MRRQDKLKVIMEANQRLEESYLNGKSLLKEDILELKQMSKQMYSFLKKKGFTVKIATEKGEVRAKGLSTRYDLSNEAQLIVQETTEIVWVIIPASAVVKVLMKESGENWHEEARKKYGDPGTWINNQEIIGYVNDLGDGLLGELKSKYPNMKHGFSRDQNISYVMQFGYGETRKGGRQE
jgi:hypothetical protein